MRKFSVLCGCSIILGLVVMCNGSIETINVSMCLSKNINYAATPEGNVILNSTINHQHSHQYGETEIELINQRYTNKFVEIYNINFNYLIKCFTSDLKGV